MDQDQETHGHCRARFSLSQETIAIVTVGVALAGLYLATVSDMRAESRAEREAIRAEARANREAFERQILRLVEQQGTLNGLVDGLRHPIASPPE